MKKAAVFLLLFLLIWSCSEENPSGPDPDDFNREAILVNWADNIILPALQSFSTSTGDLKNAGSVFAETPNQQTLDNLRSAWRESYLAWQHISVFQMDEDSRFQLRNNINLYPLCTAELNQSLSSEAKCAPEIKNNIEGGDYNFELPQQFDVQGFPALDYMLNGLAVDDAGILEYYTTHEHAKSYKNYIQDLTSRIDDLTNEVLEYWENGYRDEFVSNSGNGANASLDMMVNDYIFYYEKYLRAGKIGIPAGVSAISSGTKSSIHVEAYYSNGFSKELFMEALNAAQYFFNGNHFESTQSGESLASYLDYLNSMKEGADLTQLINDQFDAAREQGEGLNPDFVAQIESDNSKMLATYDELQKNVVYMKTDMLQALNINVDYVDADGD